MAMKKMMSSKMTKTTTPSKTTTGKTSTTGKATTTGKTTSRPVTKATSNPKVTTLPEVTVTAKRKPAPPKVEGRIDVNKYIVEKYPGAGEYKEVKSGQYYSAKGKKQQFSPKQWETIKNRWNIDTLKVN